MWWNRVELPLVELMDGFFVGRSPTQRQIEWLARRRRLRSIVDLNVEGERGQVLSPNVEASWAHAYRLIHERVSLDARLPWGPRVEHFLATIARLERPVYVHSLHGRRAAAMATIALGVELGCSGAEAMERARERGIDGAYTESHTLLSFSDREVPGAAPGTSLSLNDNKVCDSVYDIVVSEVDLRTARTPVA